MTTCTPNQGDPGVYTLRSDVELAGWDIYLTENGEPIGDPILECLPDHVGDYWQQEFYLADPGTYVIIPFDSGVPFVVV
jgi:hypothetical protein